MMLMAFPGKMGNFQVYVSLAGGNLSRKKRSLFSSQTACLFNPHPVSGYVGFLYLPGGTPVDTNGNGIGTPTPPEI